MNQICYDFSKHYYEKRRGELSGKEWRPLLEGIQSWKETENKHHDFPEEEDYFWSTDLKSVINLNYNWNKYIVCVYTIYYYTQYL